MRVILGLLKGAVCGGAVGYGAFHLGLGSGGATAFLVYAVIGFLVGIVCGKPIWRQETLWTPVIKGLFGGLISAGLYWGASKVLGGVALPSAASFGLPPETSIAAAPFALGPAIGIVYGVFVEVDDGGPEGAKPSGGGGKPGKPGKDGRDATDGQGA